MAFAAGGGASFPAGAPHVGANNPKVGTLPGTAHAAKPPPMAPVVKVKQPPKPATPQPAAIAYHNTAPPSSRQPGKVPATKPAPPPKRPAQQPSAYQRIVQSIVGPQMAYWQGQQKATNAQHLREMQALQQWNAQVNAALGTIPGQVQSDYQQAQQATNAVGQGALDALNAANPNEAAQAQLRAIGAPAAQQAQVAAQNESVFGGGGAVLNTREGAVSSSTFAADQQALLSRARGLPAIETLSARQTMTSLRAQQAKENNQIAANIAKIQSTGAKDAYSVLNQLVAHQDRQAALTQRGKIAQDTSARGWASLSERQKVDQTNAYYKGLAANNAASRLGIEQQRLQMAVAKQQAQLANGGYSQAQVNQWQKTAGKIATTAWNGTGKIAKDYVSQKDPKTGKTTKTPVWLVVDAQGHTTAVPLGTPNPPPGTQWVREGRMSYQDAVRQAVAQHIPLSIIQDSLNRYWTQPGSQASWEKSGQGRPAFSYQQRVAMGLEPGGKFFDPGAPLGMAPGFGSTKAQAVARAAQQFLGTPYVYGGNQPGGFDCSGLVQYVWHTVGGLNVPRTSEQQFHYGTPVGKGQLQPGDAVFFAGKDGTLQNPGHEAMYIGGGYIIVAPHTGERVQIVPLSSMPGYAGARRFQLVGPPAPARPRASTVKGR